MRKLYFLVSSTLSLLCSAQTILDQAETTSRTVQDPQTVILTTGFNAVSTTSNPFIAKIGASADTGSTSVDSGAGGANPSGTTDTPTNKFHDTQGNIEVTGGGQLQYTLPIALPPGIKSVAPQVNLVYTSGSGNGIAGYGWSLSGVTSISRMGKTIEKDGEVGGINLDYSDYYSFNGQRLILKSDSPAAYGKDGATYTTEKYSNVLIKSVGSDNVFNGPKYWEVTFEDGSQAWYGNDLFASTYVEYNITKWKDAQGNEIKYNYDESYNVSVIASIEWGGNEIQNKPFFNEITFDYNTDIQRAQKEVSYVAGQKFVQNQILNSITVNTNIDSVKKQFKKYTINYNSTTSNYQFVDNIIEFNSNGELDSANPASFEYNTNQNISEGFDYQYNPSNFNSKKYGDFNYDGTTDYIEYLTDGTIFFRNSVYLSTNHVRLFYDVSKFTSSDFSKAKIITFKKNNVVKNKAGLVIPHKIASSVSGKYDYELQVYSVDVLHQELVFEYSKIIPYSKYNLFETDANNDCVATQTSLSQIESYDYDGDGISDLILIFKGNERCVVYDPSVISSAKVSSEIVEELPKPTNLKFNNIDKDNTEYANKQVSETLNFYPPLGGEYQWTYYSSMVLFNMDESKTVNESFYQIKTGDDSSTPDFTFVDFNGDGISDIVELQNGKFSSAYDIKKNANSFNIVNVESFSTQSYSGLFENALYGDFNGDGKTDILVPQANKSSNWNIYISNGKSFNTSNINNFIYFSTEQELSDQGNHRRLEGGGCDYATTTYRQYNIGDLDADGKSEIIVTKVVLNDHEWNGHHDQESTYVYTQTYSTTTLLSDSTPNTAFNDTSGDIKFYNTKSTSKVFYEKVIPFSTLTLNHTNKQIILVGRADDCGVSNCDYNYVLQYNYQYLPELTRLKNITQAGILTNVEYKELNSNINPEFFSTSQQENFPFAEVESLSKSYAVSQLSQAGRMQDFRYRGLITHLQGRGMIGFRQTARSSWYAAGFENTKIWSGAEIDPLNEGVPVKEWSVHTNTESQIFPTDLSVNNTQLTSFKSTTYKTDKLLNGVVKTGTILDADKPKIVTAIVPISTTSKNFITNDTTTDTVEYDTFYLPKKTVSNINSGYGIKTTTLEYLHNLTGVGKDYFVGRPQSKTETMVAYGDTKSAKVDYTYANNLLDTQKTWNRDNSGWLQEKYTYDGFGNITQKVSSNSIDANKQTVKSIYEAQGRFVTKTTDNLGLETNITYNDWGQVLTQIDPLLNKVTNTYDDWGKLLTSKNNLSGSTSYTYEKLGNGDTKVTEYSPDNDQKISYTNNLGQNYKSTTKGFAQGVYTSKSTEFDVLGRKTKDSEPYFEGSETPRWNVIVYDDSVYPGKATATAFNGKKMETSVSGKTTSVKELNGYNRINTKTTDALGNVVSTTDKGGTITFKYNAAGEQTEALYGTNSVKTTYDAWGNKSKFDDPSNGVYEYTYQGYFGAISQIKSPKGTKQYAYNSLGQLTNQTETSTDGTSTNKVISFSYDDKGRVIGKSGTSKGGSFSSYINFDSQGKSISSGESSNGKYFMQKGITYDDKARVTSYEKSLYSSGILTKVTIENVYSSWGGDLYQVKDKTSGKILWQLDETNAKGLVKSAKLGGTTINNLYDANYFLINTSHTKTVGGNTVLQMGYTFNAIKNELNSRTRRGDFNLDEYFTYDDNNRLETWTNFRTGQLSNNVYDVKGRITSNDQVGSIKFENTTSLYRPSSVDLNAAGTANYNNNLIQTISYNENNDPIFIDGVKGDVAFQYGLTAMRQRVTYGGNFAPDQEGKFTKFYSEDGSYEILKDNVTGKEKHVLYIGGTPYESNIVFIKKYTETTGSYKFLHKDYLGSILAVSDENGNVLEQRHYDAWGNFTHLKIGAGAIITDKNIIDDTALLIDRGYTSHEHFAEVGIIHMNGRLYDPLLRRFLNADENIQDPTNTQNYNKYGYVMNNPLLYNDPSGEFFIVDDLFLSAIIIGAIIGGVSYSLQGIFTGYWNLGGFAKSVFFGAVSGAVTYGIGNLFSTAKCGVTALATSLGKTGTVFVQAAAHAVAQGALSLMQGGTFQQAFIAGALGSLGAKAWGKIGGNFAESTVGMIGFGALAGGVGSALSGGNFWQGAIIGGMVAGLNDAMHKWDDPLSFKNQKELDKYVDKNIAPLSELEKAKIKIILATDANLDLEGEGYHLGGNGNMYDKYNTGDIKGFTLPKNQDGIISIYVAPSIKSNFAQMSIVHELVHAYGFINGFVNLEGSARTYTVAYLKAIHANPYTIDSWRFPGMANYPSSASWRKLLPSFIKTGLQR